MRQILSYNHDYSSDGHCLRVTGHMMLITDFLRNFLLPSVANQHRCSNLEEAEENFLENRL